jgi:hypothetical protein
MTADLQDVLRAIARLADDVQLVRDEVKARFDSVESRIGSLESEVSSIKRIILRGLPHAHYSPPRTPNLTCGKPTVLNWTNGTLTFAEWSGVVGFVTVLHCFSVRQAHYGNELQFGALSEGSKTMRDLFRRCMETCVIDVFGEEANNEVVFITPTAVSHADLRVAFGTPFLLDSAEVANRGDCFAGLSCHGSVGGTIERAMGDGGGYWMRGGASFGTSGTVCVKGGKVIGLIHGLAENVSQLFVTPHFLITRWWAVPMPIRTIAVMDDVLQDDDGAYLEKVTKKLRAMTNGATKVDGMTG